MPSVNVPVKTASPGALTDFGAGTAMNTVDGLNFVNDGNTGLKLENSSGAPVTVTAVTSVTVEGNAVSDKVFTLPANSVRFTGKFDTRIYGTTVELTGASASALVTPFNLV